MTATSQPGRPVGPPDLPAGRPDLPDGRPDLPVGRRAELAGAVADAIDGLHGLRRLDGAGAVVASTVYPGGRVDGVQLGARVTVHIVAEQVPLAPLAARARAAAIAVLDRAGDRRDVDIVVADLDLGATGPPGGPR